MRKFSFLLAGIIFTLSSFFTYAQNVPDSCHANFEVQNSSSNPLGKYFIAQPWHNHNKKPVRICWNFGDTHDTCIQYLTSYTGNYAVYHAYAQPGNYNVCVNILYDGGCQANYCKSVLVGNPDSCSADFERIPSSNANPLLAYFRALPYSHNNNKPSQICWNFGDTHDTCINYGQDYTGQYVVSHLYANPGNYNVCVTIHYFGGCESHKCRVMQIGESDSCHASFTVQNSTSNPLGKYFIAQPWHNHNKKPVRICWNFGDLHDTCIQYSTTFTGTYGVFHGYANAGNYNVCVNILYDGGCEAHYCKIVEVISPDSCRADFERVPSPTANPLLAYFRALPWHNNNKKPTQICWKFGDNHDTCINYGADYTGQYAVSHLYANAGNYNVCVKITYQGGCVSEKCKPIQIGEPDSCRADFEKINANTGTSPLLAYFRALPWHNHNNKPSRICWTFGDGKDTCINYGQDYTGQYVVSHHYNQPGVYEVCVKILYFGGCEAKKCKIVYIIPNNDICGVHLFEITPSITSLTREFYFVQTPTSGRPKRICWNFGDGTDTCIMVDSNATTIPYSIHHTFPAPGVYHTCVKVLFWTGCTAQDCREVVIRSLTDICGGYYTDSLVNVHTYSFRGFSIHAPNDNVLGYHWTFGDGSSGTGQQVTHSYNTPGVYRVCMLVNTEKGCETKVCNNVRVAGPTQSTLQLSPNPVVNTLHVLFYSGYNEVVTIRITNSSGAIVRTYTRNAVIGANTWDFDLSGLLPGVYSLSVQSPNQYASAIFFKQ